MQDKMKKISEKVEQCSTLKHFKKKVAQCRTDRHHEKPMANKIIDFSYKHKDWN